MLKRELELKGRTAQTDPVLRLTSGSYPRDTITTLSFSEAIGLLTQRAASYSLGAYDATNAAFTKLEVAAKLLLSKRFRGLLLHGDADIDKKRLNICWPTKANALDMQNGSERDQTLKKAAQSKYLSDHPNGIYDIPFDGFEYLTGDYAYLDRETARRITVFAQQRGFRIAFFYLPAYYTQIPSPHFQAQFALTIGAPLIVPDHKTLTSLYPYYYDSTHLNINGINLFTRWIVHELKERGLAGRDNKL